MKRTLALIAIAALIASTVALAAGAVLAATPEKRPAAKLMTLNYSDASPDALIARKLDGALRRSCGTRVEVVSKSSHAELEYALIRGDYDLAVLPPHIFLMNMGKIEYSPIAIFVYGSPSYRAAIFSSGATGIRSLEDIKPGTKIQFVDPFSASGFVVPYIGLRTGLPDGKLKMLEFGGFTGSHRESAARAAAGRTALVASYSTLAEDNKKRYPDLVKVHEFETRIPNDVIVASKKFLDGLPARERKAFAARAASLMSGKKRVTAPYSNKHMAGYSSFAAALEAESAPDAVRISVPAWALARFAAAAGSEDLALRAVERLAATAFSGTKCEAKAVANVECAIWDLISGTSAAAYLGRGPEAAGIAERFKRLKGDRHGFYAFGVK